MVTGFAFGCLGAGILLLVIALALRVATRVSWPTAASDELSADAAPSTDDKTDIGPTTAEDAVLAGRPRRAVAAALAALEVRGAVSIARPEKGRAPEVRIRDIDLVSRDDRALLDAYATEGAGRSAALWNAIDTVGGRLTDAGVAGRAVRWPARVMVPLATLGVIVSLVTLAATIGTPVATAAAIAATAAFIASIALVPGRIQRPRAAAHDRLAGLTARRSASDPASLALFASADRLRATTVGADGVTLGALAKAADPGPRQARVFGVVLDVLTFWN